MKKTLLALLANFIVPALFADCEVEDSASDLDFAAISLGLCNPVQTASEELNIHGVRFSGFYGRNADVYGLDFGIVGSASRDFAGLGISAANLTDNDVAGLRIGALANVSDGNLAGVNVGLVNLVTGETDGLQLGAISYSGTFRGAQLGLLGNWNGFASAGWQLGVMNYNQDKFAGLSTGVFNLGEKISWIQLGVVNTATEVSGVQIGVFNACDEICGVQIGVLNIIDASPVPIMPVLNASF